MKVTVLTLSFFIIFINFANAGEMYSCIDRDGNEIITDTPQDGMKCSLKDTFRDPSPEELAEKEAIKKQSELSKLAPLYSGSYIIVYGKDSCGWTQKYRKDFENMNIHYVYKSVDDKNVRNELFPRMKKAGLYVSSVDLPVIDVNAHILIRPEMKIILDIYKTE